jgi:hypothetical protein
MFFSLQYVMKKLILFLVVIIQTSCAFMLSYIKDKKPSVLESDAARIANEYMWEQFHLGNYDSIPLILAKLNRAYQLDPNDARVAGHLGFMYLWNFSERIRHQAQDRILENIFLSNRFFKEAITLNPRDPRIYGFQSAVQMCEGALTNNLEILAESYFTSLKAIRRWSQFNKFALGYVESQLDPASRMYKQGLKYQWEILDECSEKKLSKKNILEAPGNELSVLYNEIKNSDNPEITRACGNSWIAPHNWEGFFLNFGDMLVKAGELEEAKVIYQAARIAPSFDDWPYKNVIEIRIKNADSNQSSFNLSQDLIQLTNRSQMMINSEFSCAGCHQMSDKEFARAGYQEPLNEIYFLAGMAHQK